MSPQDLVKALRAAARRIHFGMPRGGRQGTKKGKRGYTRKPKHVKKDAPQLHMKVEQATSNILRSMVE